MQTATRKLLQGKAAVVYGAAGAVGSAVSTAFAREGARLFLTGRNKQSLEKLAHTLRESGAEVDASTVDALDRQAVQKHLDRAVASCGRVDVSFNLISMGDVQGTPLIEMPEADFMQPIDHAMRSQLITASSAGKLMSQTGSGVILILTASPGRIGAANVGGFGPACAALEGFARQLAGEIGPRGVRVVCLRSAGSPEAPGVQKVFELHAKARGIGVETFAQQLAEASPLRHLPTLEEVANAAALLASDYASAMTGTVANITCGSSPD